HHSIICFLFTLYLFRFLVFSFPTRRAPTSTLFPYTTLFRSTYAGTELHFLGYFVDHRLPLLTEFAATAAERRSRRILGMIERLADRKSTRLNSSHVKISYAVFCLKKKTSDP